MVGKLDELRAKLTPVTVLRTATLSVGAILMLACGKHQDVPHVASSADSQAAHVAEVVAGGGVVDSIVPVAEALRRFRSTIPYHADSLRDASSSLDALLLRFASAVSARDSAALNAMLLDRAEFAWLYYPDSPLSMPPYEAPPGLLWSQLLAVSDEGVKQLLRRYGGHPLTIDGFTCPAPRMNGRNRVHEHCEVRARVAGKAIGNTRLFGSIIERDGRFKFLGYANSL